VVCLVVGTAMFVAADRIVRSTRLGRGIRAVAQDSETSALMGVNIDRTITLTFIIGGSLAGAAGFLYALQNGIVQSSGTELGIYAFTAAVLGGIGNLRGAALGGLLIGLFGSFSVPFAFEGNISWTEIYTFIILVLVLIVRPTGILGEKSGRTA
jgi:branched-chain amino acid transport system permease protein